MSNATAAGPSRGILEVLFGSKKSEEPETDGKGFMAMMNLIKTMNEKNEEIKAELGRTHGETAPGKNGMEDPIVGMPWLNAPFISGQPPKLMQVPDGEAAIQASALKEGAAQPNPGSERERLEKLASLLGVPGIMLVQQQAQPSRMPEMAPMKAEQVNDLLKQKSLPPLTAEEAKLLQEVNSKLNAVSQGGMEKAAFPRDQIPEGLFLKELGLRGIDPGKVKSGELLSTNAAPDKMMTTEAYLQMQELAKAPGKPIANDGPMNNLASEFSPAQMRSSESLTQNAVTGAEQKGMELNAHRERDAQDLASLPKPKAQTLSGASFAAGLMQQLQQGQDLNSKDIYLPGDKPSEMRSALLNEVGTGVSLQALKGGGEMRLVIHPDDLGEVKLKVSTKDGKVEVQVMAQNDDVAKLIRGGSKDLENSLRDQNLSLAKFEVSVNPSDTAVVSTDTRSNLSDQFLSQNQQHNSSAFGQGSMAEDGRSARWNGDQGGRQNSGYGANSREDASSGTPVRASARHATRNSTSRLDVVA